MNNWTLLGISLVVNLAGGVFKMYLVDTQERSAGMRHMLNAVVSATAALGLTLTAGNLQVSMFTVLLALAFGLVTAVQQVASLQAMETGPYSYTSVIVSLSTLIPTMSGVLIWKESLSWLQMIGIGLMVVCFVLSVEKDQNQKKATVKWLLYCAVAFVCTGLIGVMQKWHQNTDYKTELDGFLVIAFAVSFVYSASCLGINRIAEGKQIGKKFGKYAALSILLMILIGASAATCNKLNLYLSGAMDSSVFFPIVNGGGLVLTTLAAMLLFKERLSHRRWIGIAIGILSVLCLCV